MQQRRLLFLILTVVVLNALILVRIHSISEGVNDETSQVFPGLRGPSSFFNANQNPGVRVNGSTQKSHLIEEKLVERDVSERTGNGSGKPGKMVEEPANRPLDKMVDVVEGKQKTSQTLQRATEQNKNSTQSEVIQHAQNKRDEVIEEANYRLLHVADKANVRHPKDLGLEFKNNHHDGRPPFDEIVDVSGNITRDVSDLLQFAVVGFGKAGTTTMMDWIDSHPRMQCFPEEVVDLMKSTPATLLAKLYTLPSGDFQRGYKSPLDLVMPHIPQQIAKLFPKTKLIVGIRHPIRWFESLCKCSKFSIFRRTKIYLLQFRTPV